jgi:CRISP-associated protein Cas1
MTIKGKVNHYNIKVLRGYGVSIKLKDNRVVLQNGYDFFTKTQEKEEWFVTQIPYEKIVISGNTCATPTCRQPLGASSLACQLRKHAG